ncbi:ABC transporter ATP-binding protein, partial [Staphylococcus felis]|uniref:ATP-binding cassette domain-containing protein n=1 Tax=Staphylococcus felis TaxID=46127 RepID=UPI000E36E6DE
MKKPIISVKNLCLSFDDTLILNNLEYSFYSSNIYTILGINGSGKTSFLKCIVGMLKYNSGNIKLYQGNTISFVPDSSYLYEYLTGLEYLYFVGKLNDMNNNEVIERSESLLKELYLHSSRNKLIKNYSNGMKQKLSLASSMLTQPNIICIDEPLTGTDYASNK